jgi:tetratricopeptide (TPR) repeat protein
MGGSIRLEEIPAVLARAVALHGAGDLAQAEQLYKKVLEVQSQNPTALHLLGVIAYQCGHGEQSVALISRALELQSNFPEAHSNLGLALFSLERYEEARDAFKEALRLQPQFPDALSNQALVLQELGQPGLALQSHLDVARLQPEIAFHHYNLGICLAELDRDKEAVSSFNRAIKLQANYPDANFNLGLAYFRLGYFEQAIFAFHQAVEQNPQHAAALSNLGTTFFELGHFSEAVASYRKALELDSGYTDARHNLGLAEAALGNTEEAVAHYLNALELQPEHAEAYSNLGNALRELGQVEQAFDSFRKAIEIKPEYAEAHHNLANLYYDTGDMVAAEKSYSQAISLQADHASAHRSRTRVVKHREYNQQITAMEELLDTAELTAEQRMHLGFGLGKAMEDIGEYDRAFDYYKSANAYKREQCSYSIEREGKRFDEIKQAYSGKLFEQLSSSGSTDSTPIFIVGMPRSGTSLVEQILASHVDVYGGGELMLMAETAREILGSNTQADLGASLASISVETLKSSGEDYVRKLRSRSQSALRITDKMPGNFEFIGLIKLILPNAKIIHCRRGAEDTCLSVYKNYFSSRGHYYAYELSELGHFYREYQSLMEHWSDLLPGFVYDIQYEDVVANQEQQARALLAHCGLDWDPGCLDFHTTARSVRTASAAQVRQPIYDTSVAVWKRYESSLGPLLKALGS